MLELALVHRDGRSQIHVEQIGNNLILTENSLIMPSTENEGGAGGSIQSQKYLRRKNEEGYSIFFWEKLGRFY